MSLNVYCKYVFRQTFEFDTDAVDWISRVIGRDYGHARVKLPRRMDRAVLDYVLKAFKQALLRTYIEYCSTLCNSQPLYKHKVFLEIHRFIFQVDDSDYHRAKCDERVSKLNCVQTAEIQQPQDQQAVVNEDTRMTLTSSLPPLDTQPSDVTADDIKALEDENQSLKQTVEAMKQELAISQSGRIFAFSSSCHFS